MKVKVIKRFRDKLNGFKVREIGDTLEVTESRFKELTKTSLGIFVEEIKSPPSTPSTTVKDGVKPSTKRRS